MEISSENNLPLFLENAVQFLKELSILTIMPCKFTATSKHVVICAMQKSASTFIHNALSFALDYQIGGLAETYKLEDIAKRLNCDDHIFQGHSVSTHHLYLPKLLIAAYSGFNTVSQHHLIANTQTLWNFQAFKTLIPIVTTRNILDAIVSLRDHIVREFQCKTDFEARYSFGDHMWRFRTKRSIDRFLSESLEYQIDFLIQICAPWYFEFLLSWEEVRRQGILNPLFISYEELVNDEYSTIVRAIEFIGENVNKDKIISSIYELKRNYSVQINFNIGKVGRGHELFTPLQKKNLRKVGEYYADDEIIEKYVESKDFPD